MKKTLFCAALALVTCAAQAQKMRAPKGGTPISEEFLGIFFEDISYAADGGLNAQLVQNGSFEYSPNERDGWGPGTAWKRVAYGHSTGYIDYVRGIEQLNKNNPTYMRVVVLTVSIFRRERNIIFQLSCVTQLVRQKMCALSFKVSSSSLR